MPLPSCCRSGKNWSESSCPGKLLWGIVSGRTCPGHQVREEFVRFIMSGKTFPEDFFRTLCPGKFVRDIRYGKIYPCRHFREGGIVYGKICPGCQALEDIFWTSGLVKFVREIRSGKTYKMKVLLTLGSKSSFKKSRTECSINLV